MHRPTRGFRLDRPRLTRRRARRGRCRAAGVPRVPSAAQCASAGRAERRRRQARAGVRVPGGPGLRSPPAASPGAAKPSEQRASVLRPEQRRPEGGQARSVAGPTCRRGRPATGSASSAGTAGAPARASSGRSGGGAGSGERGGRHRPGGTGPPAPGRAGTGGGDGAAAQRRARGPGPPRRWWWRGGPLSPGPELRGRQAGGPPSPGRCAVRGPPSGPCWPRGSGGGSGADPWGRGSHPPAPGPPAPRSPRWWPSGRSGGRRGPRLPASLPAPSRPSPRPPLPSPCPKRRGSPPGVAPPVAADGGRERAASAPGGALMRRLDLRCATSGASPGGHSAMQLLKALWALAGAALCCFLVLVMHAQFLKEGQLAAGTCEIVTLDRDSSQPRRTIARQTARCACRKGQIAGTTRARPACVDARIIRTKQWCDMLPCLEGEGCDLLINRSGWTCTQPGGRIKTTTVS